jgi:hypothetical protein
VKEFAAHDLVVSYRDFQDPVIVYDLGFNHANPEADDLDHAVDSVNDLC